MTRLAQEHGLRVSAWCVMPDHVHVVVSTSEAGGDVEGWARYTKREVQRLLGAHGLWERSYWDRDLRQDEDVATAVEYVLANPTRKGLCEDWAMWPHLWSEWHEDVLEGRMGPLPHAAPPGDPR